MRRSRRAGRTAPCFFIGDGRWQFGNAATILTDSNLSALYEVPVGELAWRGQRVFVSA